MYQHLVIKMYELHNGERVEVKVRTDCRTITIRMHVSREIGLHPTDREFRSVGTGLHGRIANAAWQSIGHPISK